MGLGKRGYASWHSSKVRGLPYTFYIQVKEKVVQGSIEGLEEMNKREDRSGPNTIGSRGNHLKWRFHTADGNGWSGWMTLL